MLHADGRTGGNIDPFPCDLDGKLIPGFQCICQAFQLGDELLCGIDFLNVTFTLLGHIISSSIF
jgi:hypothetical protein